MNIINAIILGIVQGMTEFLPVSSSGHLILFKKIFGMDTEVFGLSFDIALHFATLIAVFVVLWSDIVMILKKPIQKLTLLVIIATIPAGIAGILLDDYVESLSQDGGFLGLAFLVTAVVLVLTDKIGRKIKIMHDMKYSDAVYIGLAQALALMPGISRSGSTLSTGLFTGLKREDATRFAFLMSIPVILGSALIGVKNMIETPGSVDVWALVAGMIAAAVSGYISVKFMLGFVKKHSLRGFAIYVGVLGVLILVDQLIFNKFFDVFLV